MATELSARPPLRAMFGSLRVRLALATLLLLAAGASASAWYMSGRLELPYEDSVRAQLEGVGSTLALDLDRRDLEDPEALERRLRQIRRANPELLGITVFRRGSSGPELVAAARAPTARGRTLAERREVRRRALGGYGLPPLERRRRALPPPTASPDIAELAVPVRAADGATIGEVLLELDRTASDAALARDVRRMVILAALVALAVGLAFAGLLSRAVLGPLRQLREAFQSLRAGAGGT